MYYPVHSPKWVQWLFSKYLWRFGATENKKLYLTFDDGPIPVITPWVLEQLDHYNAKATFFCVGNNVEKYPDIYQQILTAGHSVGNHTFSHISGWANSTEDYIKNVERCQEKMQASLFRPPYGRLKLSQAKQLTKEYTIVMWDVIAGDFDKSIDGEKCFNNVLNNTTNGSIVVLHDSKKAWDRLEYVLPRLLKYYTKLGFSFEPISSN